MTNSYLRQQARDALRGNWGIAIFVTFLASVLGGLVVGSNFSLEIDMDEQILAHLPDALQLYISITAKIGAGLAMIQFIVGGAIQLGYCRFLLNLHDGKPADIKDLFSQFSRLLDGLLLVLLQTLYVFLWTLLFIIPGIVAAYKYALAPFILLENPGMKANDAIRESKERMDGNKADLFMLDLSFIGWALLNVLTLGIGSFWLNPYMNASRAAFYRNLCPLPASTPDPDYGFETPTGQSYEL